MALVRTITLDGESQGIGPYFVSVVGIRGKKVKVVFETAQEHAARQAELEVSEQTGENN